MKNFDFDEWAHISLLVVWVVIVVIAFATQGVVR